MTTTPHLGLPLPDPNGTLDVDVVRIVDAFILLDTKLKAIDTLLSSDDLSLDTVQELVLAIKSAQGELDAILSQVDSRFDTLVAGYNQQLQDMATAISGKAEQSHAHSLEDVNGLAKALEEKQPALDSGVNIKTVNNQSLLGSGNLVIHEGATGANVQEISTDLALTKESAFFQSLAATTENLCVILPDATTLIEGGALYALNNPGPLPIGVRNFGGLLMTVIQPGQIGITYLKDNSSQAGLWAFGSEQGGELGGALAHAAVSVGDNAAVYSTMKIVGLSQETALLVHSNDATYMYAYVLTISGNEISVGPVNTFPVVNDTANNLVLARLNDTTAIIALYTSSSDPTAVIDVLQVDGTTVTRGTSVSATYFSATTISFSSLNSTQALICGRNGGGTYYHQILTVQDGVCSLGSAVAFGSTSDDNQVHAVLDHTLVATATKTATTGNTVWFRTISDTSILTTGVPVASIAIQALAGHYPVGCVWASPSELLVASISTNPYKLGVVRLLLRTTATGGTEVIVTPVEYLQLPVSGSGDGKTNMLHKLTDGTVVLTQVEQYRTNIHPIKIINNRVVLCDGVQVPTSFNNFRPPSLVGDRFIIGTAVTSVSGLVRVVEVA